MDPNRFPKVPSDKGIELMNSGTFGASEIKPTIRSKKRLARRILDREMGLGNTVDRHVNQSMMTQVRNHWHLSTGYVAPGVRPR